MTKRFFIVGGLTPEMRERGVVSVQRLVERFAAFGLVGFLVELRCDGLEGAGTAAQAEVIGVDDTNGEAKDLPC